ncbi:hypothetical protein AB4238_20185 [Shewanella sp. 10N.286.45.A1]|uniref:hypothetical protein n=1 Tax=Shewanella sp. 10N.286.45.A1 TaxID=3229694 RepID=UPI003550246C
MTKTNTYKLYGLCVQTKLLLPAALTHEKASIKISSAPVPLSLSNVISSYRNLQFNGEQALINQPLFGSLLIEKQRKISYNFYPDLTESHAITAILGSGLGTLLHLNGQIPLHGLALATAKGAIILLADSGTGKSTLATALIQAKQTVYTDDIVALQYNHNHQLCVNPAHKRFKLSPTNLVDMDLNISTLSTTAPGVNKLGWDIPDDRFAIQAQPIIKCIFISSDRAQDSKANIIKLSRFDSFKQLHHFTYRRHLVRLFKQQETFFKLNRQLQHQCDSYRMLLPELSKFNSTKEYGEAISEQLTGLLT